jgi:hypothetical protein
MHFANVRTDSHHIVHAPGHRSPPPPLGPPHLYNLNHSSSSPPVFLKMNSSPRPEEHSPLRHISHHAYTAAFDKAGSTRSASPSSPQLQPRSGIETHPSPSFAPVSPATPMDAEHRAARQGSPLAHHGAMTPTGSTMAALPLSPPSGPAWLTSSKSLKRGSRVGADAQSTGSRLSIEAGDPSAVQHVRQFLQFSPMSTQMPSLQSGGSTTGAPAKLQTTQEESGGTPRAGSSPRHSFDSTRRGSLDRFSESEPNRRRILSPSPQPIGDPLAAAGSSGEQPLRLEAMIAVHIRDAEQHHREAIVESFAATFQEMRLDSMMQRNVLAQEVHRRSDRIQSILSQSSTPSLAAPPASMPQHATVPASTTWMARPQLGFPEAAQPRAESMYQSEQQLPMSRSASESLQVLRGRLSYASEDVTTPRKQPTATSESPFLYGGSYSAVRGGAMLSSTTYRSQMPSTQQTPRTMASKYAMEALLRVVQDEERSRRTLIEASSTNASVILRQLFHCWVRGLHPTTLYVQEQHSFNTLMSAFEEESISVHEQYQRWLWEQRAERIQFWTKRLATLRMDEDRDRDSAVVQQRDLWNEMMRRAEIGRQQITRDTVDAQQRAESRLRRSIAALVALEATVRDSMTVNQEQLRAEILAAEDDAFHCSIDSVTRLGAVVAEERNARVNHEGDERGLRRELEQMRKWAAPVVTLVPPLVSTAAVGAGIMSSPEGSPKSDRPLLGEDPLSVVSLDDSGYFLTHGEDHQHEPSPQQQTRTPRRRRSPTTNRRHTTPIAPNEHYMRHTASSSRRQSSPGTTDRSPSQDNLFGGSLGGLSQNPPPSDIAAIQQVLYDTASSVRHPTSSLASDAEGAPPPFRGQQQPQQQQQRVVVSPLQMQRTVDRLSKPKRRAEHIVENDDELPSYTLSNNASSFQASAHFTDERPSSTRRAQVNALSPSRQRASVAAARAASARRRSNGHDEPMSMPSMRPVAQGNSVMILRGGPAPTPRASTTKRSVPPASDSSVASRSNEVRSARRYVDAFYAPSPQSQEHSQGHRDVSSASMQLSQSPIVISGHSLVSSDGNISNTSQLPPTGRRVVQQQHSREETSTTTARTRVGGSSGTQRLEKLSKWEVATLLMYEQSRKQ